MIRPAVRPILISPMIAVAILVGFAANSAQTAEAKQPSATSTSAPAGAAAAIPAIAHTVTVTESQNGKVVTVAKNDTLIVSLPISLGGKYSWVVSSFDPTQLKAIGKPEIKQTNGPTQGAAAQQVFRFQPLMSGSGALEIDYVQPSAKSFRPAQVFTITVTVR